MNAYHVHTNASQTERTYWLRYLLLLGTVGLSILTCCKVSPPTTEKTTYEAHKEASIHDANQDASPAPPEKKNTQDAVPGEEITLPAKGGEVCAQKVCVAAPKSSLPPGKPARLFVRPYTQKVPLGSIGPVLDVGPDDWKPTGPVQIQFSYDDLGLVSGIKYTEMSVAFLQNGTWTKVPTVADDTQRTLTGTSTHFSVWTVIPNFLFCKVDSGCTRFIDAFCYNAMCMEKNRCQSRADCPNNQECKKQLCVPPCRKTPEYCNGFDDDCDGQVDNGCIRACSNNLDCNKNEDCKKEVCTPR